MSFQSRLHRVLNGHSLSEREAQEAFADIMDGVVSPVQLGAFLAALHVKGETVDELVGAAGAMRAAAVPFRSHNALVLDCCGTGGDGQSSFNVSSAVACVVAGAGYTMAKHGNRSVSSKSGSADVFEACGVRLDAPPALLEQALEEIGFVFLFAPLFHPAMKYAAPVRRELAARTIFNLLGPLCNPARPQVQLIGVFDECWLVPMAEAAVKLGVQEGAVVFGEGHDELVLSGPNRVASIESGQVRQAILQPEDFGLKTQPEARIPGSDALENARTLEQLLSGQRGELRDVVCMNAALLIQAASRRERPGRPFALPEAFDAAQNAIDRGLALEKLRRLRELTRSAKAA